MLGRLSVCSLQNVLVVLRLAAESSLQAAAIARSSTLTRLGPMALRVMRAGLTAARIAAKAAAAANAACAAGLSDELLKELQAAMQATKQTSKARKEVRQPPARLVEEAVRVHRTLARANVRTGRTE